MRERIDRERMREKDDFERFMRLQAMDEKQYQRYRQRSYDISVQAYLAMLESKGCYEATEEDARFIDKTLSQVRIRLGDKIMNDASSFEEGVRECYRQFRIIIPEVEKALFDFYERAYKEGKRVAPEAKSHINWLNENMQN